MSLLSRLVCVCVCVCGRARACVCVCGRARACVHVSEMCYMCPQLYIFLRHDIFSILFDNFVKCGPIVTLFYMVIAEYNIYIIKDQGYQNVKNT